jgi:hypothetical protein
MRQSSPGSTPRLVLLLVSKVVALLPRHRQFVLVYCEQATCMQYSHDKALDSSPMRTISSVSPWPPP